MSTTYRIDSTHGCVQLAADGPLTKQQLLDVFDCFLDDPDFRPGMNVLVDLRDAEIRMGLESVTAVIEHVSRNRSRRGENYRVALVVTSGFQETMAQIYRIYSRSLPYTPAVFHTLTDAQEWLGHTISTPSRGEHLPSSRSPDR